MLDMKQLRHFHNDLRRFTLKLAVVSNRLPAGFLLVGVQCSNTLTSDPGGFADVFCGTLGLTKVAVKRLRTRMIPSEDEVISLTKVGTVESRIQQTRQLTMLLLSYQGNLSRVALVEESRSSSYSSVHRYLKRRVPEHDLYGHALDEER